jgi:hypothetical protein
MVNDVLPTRARQAPHAPRKMYGVRIEIWKGTPRGGAEGIKR